MKSYKEMANSVIERRDAYLLRKRKIKKSILQYGTSLLCIVIIAVIAFHAGYHQGTLPSPNNPSNNQDDFWIPSLPYLDKDTLQGVDPSTQDEPLDPWFTNFNDFENWLITGKLGNNIPSSLQNDKQYLAKWVYMWQNADYHLKTGYYYRPTIENNTLNLGEIEVKSYENGYRIYYRYHVNHDTTCDDFNAYKLNIFVNDSPRIQEDFQNEYKNAHEKDSRTIYNKIIFNQVTYHVFVGDSSSENCNFIGIYWEQDSNWYYGYYLASKKDVNGYQGVIKNLNMVKTSFRDHLQP